MDCDPPEYRHLLGDGDAGQLVPERQLATGQQQDPALDRLVDGVQTVTEDGAEQGDLGPGPGQRHDVQGVPCGLRQPGRTGEDGVAHRRRDRSRAGGEHLGDEERVAPGPAVQVVRVDAGPVARQLADRRGRERAQVEPPGAGSRRRVAQHAAQQVVGADVLRPVGDQDQRSTGVDPAGQVQQEVEG